jgi:hypothetical protein
MTIFADDVFTAIPGNFFSFFVKVENPPAHVVGNDAILHIVQDPFQIFSVGQYVVDGQGVHFRSICSRKTEVTDIETAHARDRATCDKRGQDNIKSGIVQPKWNGVKRVNRGKNHRDQ